jgi:hypothetical protein
MFRSYLIASLFVDLDTPSPAGLPEPVEGLAIQIPEDGG